jgi:hypothetical protein
MLSIAEQAGMWNVTPFCMLGSAACTTTVQQGTPLQMRTSSGLWYPQDGMAQRPETIAAAVGLSAREVSAVFGAVLQQNQGNTSDDEASLRWLSQLLQHVCDETSGNRTKAGTGLQMATALHAHVTATYAVLTKGTPVGYIFLLLAKHCSFCWQCTAWRNEMADLIAGGISGRPSGDSWVQSLQKLLAALSARATAAGV